MGRKCIDADKIDCNLGKKVQVLRLTQGLNLQQLASAIDVSVHQLTKYEKGINSISIGRLVLIAEALHVEVMHFFEDIDTISAIPLLTEDDYLSLELATHFMKIKNPMHKKAINSFIKTLAKVP
jgi:transcriptional regulator with XRE-family HTH domain